jgi:hypothetical protein
MAREESRRDVGSLFLVILDMIDASLQKRCRANRIGQVHSRAAAHVEQ